MHDLHVHSHDHNDHSHAGIAAFDSIDQAIALMSYMLDHNAHHAEELHDLAHKLVASGKEEAAHLIDHALEQYEVGNANLAEALDSLKKEL